MIESKLCSYCGVDRVEPCCKVYCKFCYYRFQRVRRMYTRARKTPMEIRKLHRTWNYWRTSAALDAMYPDLPESEDQAA